MTLSPSDGRHPGRRSQTGEINVLDTVTGTNIPLLTPIVEGVQVFNPTVSSLNNTLMAVEISDGFTFGAYGFNLFTGQLALLFDNGFDIVNMDYSSDDQFMIFNRTNLADPILAPDVYRIPLAGDKLSVTGPEELVFPNAVLPIWFTQLPNAADPAVLQYR